VLAQLSQRPAMTIEEQPGLAGASAGRAGDQQDDEGSARPHMGAAPEKNCHHRSAAKPVCTTP
jgi:hypothetical protein